MDREQVPKGGLLIDSIRVFKILKMPDKLSLRIVLLIQLDYWEFSPFHEALSKCPWCAQISHNESTKALFDLLS